MGRRGVGAAQGGATMTEQKLTVTGLYRPGWHRWPELGQVPHLPLTGDWLAEAAFRRARG